MTEQNEFDTAYVSWNIPVTNELARVQTEICNKYDLIPRKELHITLGFIGRADRKQLERLFHILKEQFLKIEMYFNVEGLGGALLKNEKPSLILEPKLIFKPYPRVFWLSVNKTEDMQDLISILSYELEVDGLGNSHIRKDYTPHITMGSNGPAGNDWSDWDVHTVDKSRYFMQKQINSIHSNVLHITDVQINPNSLYIIKQSSA